MGENKQSGWGKVIIFFRFLFNLIVSCFFFFYIFGKETFFSFSNIVCFWVVPIENKNIRVCRYLFAFRRKQKSILFSSIEFHKKKEI